MPPPLNILTRVNKICVSWSESCLKCKKCDLNYFLSEPFLTRHGIISERWKMLCWSWVVLLKNKIFSCFKRNVIRKSCKTKLAFVIHQNQVLAIFPAFLFRLKLLFIFRDIFNKYQKNLSVKKTEEEVRYIFCVYF